MPPSSNIHQMCQRIDSTSHRPPHANYILYNPCTSTTKDITWKPSFYKVISLYSISSIEYGSWRATFLFYLYSVTIELEITELREAAYKFYFCMTYLDAKYNIEEQCIHFKRHDATKHYKMEVWRLDPLRWMTNVGLKHNTCIPNMTQLNIIKCKINNLVNWDVWQMQVLG